MDKVEVTQRDREAAATFAEQAFPTAEWDCIRIRKGANDEHLLVQSHARHRIAAEQRIVEWLRANPGWPNSYAYARKVIADAIARGEHREKGKNTPQVGKADAP
jgi:hypothetical protein